MEHDHSPLAAYVLGGLAHDEIRAIEAHLASCDECRAELAEFQALEAALGEVPPEAFLDGPPEGGDLLLQRTLRQVRKDRVQASRPRRMLVAAGIAGLVAAALAGGTLIGRGTAPAPQAGGGTPTASAPAGSPTASGTRTYAAKDPNTGASMTVTLTPAAGWVKLHVKADGIKAGQRCVLQVVDSSGHHTQAGSWLVSANGAKNGTSLDGTALVAPADVASIDVVNYEGETLVSVPTV